MIFNQIQLKDSDLYVCVFSKQYEWLYIIIQQFIYVRFSKSYMYHEAHSKGRQCTDVAFESRLLVEKMLDNKKRRLHT